MLITSAATNSEVSERKSQTISQDTTLQNDAPVAVLHKSARGDSIPGGTLACVLPWGHGWGWSTLPNGVWSGGKITWKKDINYLVKHAYEKKKVILHVQKKFFVFLIFLTDDYKKKKIYMVKELFMEICEKIFQTDL